MAALKHVFVEKLARAGVVETKEQSVDAARLAFKLAFQLGREVRCSVCDRVVIRTEGAYFLFLRHEDKGEHVGMACGDLCLHRARKYGIS